MSTIVVAIHGDFSENLYAADYVDLHQKIEAIKVWTPAETIPLIPLSGELAKTLSATCAKLGSTQQNLLVAEHDRRMLSDGELQAFIKRQISEYDHMCNTLDGALEICLNAAL